MSLYGDLPQAKDDKGGEPAWAAAAKKLAPNLRKQTALAPPMVLRAGRGGSGGRGPGPSPAGRGAGRAGPAPVNVKAEAVKADAHAAVSTASLSSTIAPGPITVTAQAVAVRPATDSLFAVDGQDLKDEYDPSRPNDYEEIMRERDRQRRLAEEAAERAAREKAAKEEEERKRKVQEAAAAFVLAAAQPGGMVSASPSPQVMGNGSDERSKRLAISGEDAHAARARLSQPGAAGAAGPGPGSAAGMEPTKGMSLAEKLLRKMGWREGEGLGRSRQGMTTPLVAQKTGAVHGVIQNAPDLAPPPDKRARTGVTFNRPPTRVLALRNMVGPGQVDEMLEEEVGEELTKYGQVLDVLIFEVTTPGWPEEEAVRIFVKFEAVASAIKARIDLEGRFFAGREVRADFFEEERFDKAQLAPQEGEFGS